MILVWVALIAFLLFCKVITMFVRGGANIGETRTLISKDGRTVTGTVKKHLAGTMGTYPLTGGKEYDPGEHWYEMELEEEGD